MRIIKILSVYAVVCLIFTGLFVTPLFAEGNARVVVKKIGQKELDMLLKNGKGRTLMVAMASWCGPCRDELPILVKMNNKYKDKGLRIIGVSVDSDGPEAMQKIADKAKVNFPIYLAGEKAGDKYRIYAIPMLFLIKDGKVIERIPGQMPEAALEKKINGLLK